MEQSPIVVILLCTLCLPAALPSGLEIPSESELPSGLEIPSESELPSGLEIPLESELPSGLEIPSGSEISSGSELPSESELPSGSEISSELEIPLGLEIPLESEIPSGSEISSGSELPLGSKLPSGSEISSGSELPLGSELPSESGSEIPSKTELPSGTELLSGSELPSGSEIPSGSELPSGPELPSGSELPSESGSEIPSGSELLLGSESIPVGLKAAVVVNSTSCSASCGPGVKEELLCEVSPAGEHRNCSLVRSRCLSHWLCGLRHLRLPEGKPFQLICLSPATASLEGQNFGYSWRFARGLITTNDLLFHPFRNPSPSLSFSPALESHSGTYRCDVQVLSSFQLVKRIYFGLRVIPRDLVDLDFEKSLTWEQQLAASGEEPVGNVTGPAEWERQRGFWGKQWFYEAVVGIGSGVIAGILFSLGLCCLGRICRKRVAREMNAI